MNATSGQAGSGASGAIRLLQSKGSAMFPLVPHRSLLGVEPRPPDRIRPGELVVLQEAGGRSAVRRLIRRNAETGELQCMSDADGRAPWIAADRCLGAIAWRSCRGDRTRLVPRGTSLLQAWFLAVCRAESRLPRPLSALFALQRRLLLPRVYPEDPPRAEAVEETFLLRSLRAALLPGSPAPNPPPAGLDWLVCLDLALTHRVGGLLRPGWEQLPPRQRPPEGVLEMLAGQDREGEAAWRESMDVLPLLDAEFSARGIAWLLLKGPALCSRYAGGWRERPFADLDLLVPAGQREAALSVLTSRGYRPEGGGAGAFLLRRIHFHFELDPPAPLQLPVELHWALVDRANFLRIDPAGVFARARRIRLGSASMPAPAPEDELLYLCIHLAKHGVLNRLAASGQVGADWIVDGHSDNRLIWFVDLHRLLLAPEAAPDAATFWRRAGEWNAVEEAVECLSLLQELFPSAAAGRFLQGAPPEALPLAPRAAGGGRPPNLRRLRGAMRVHPVLALRPIRLAELARLMFPPAARLRSFYGARSAGSLALRRLLHPLRMLIRIAWG